MSNYSESVGLTHSESAEDQPAYISTPASVATPSSVRTTVFRKYSSLALASGSFAVFIGLLYTFFRFSDTLTGGVIYFWCIVGMLIPLLSCIHYSLEYLGRCRQREDPNAALVCSVEVCISNETVLTVRSWWSVGMATSDVERHGVRVAMSSARRWIADNSQPGGKITRVKFSEEAASELCDKYICEHSEHCHEEHSQCSVCLDDLEAGHSCYRMKKCGHAFHKECLTAWISQSSRLSCLLCRADHFDLVPQSVLNHHIVKEEPSLSVLTVNIERGMIAASQ